MISIVICTSLKRDLSDLLCSAVQSGCGEILLIGDEGRSLPQHEAMSDPRVRALTGPPDLAAKRNIALRESGAEVVAYIDDDALLSEGWYEALESAFDREEVGVATGPSILPDDATYWERVSQIVMWSTQYSRKRYTFGQGGFVEWWNVIGANFAFRRVPMLSLGGCPTQFLAQGDDMAMAWKMEQAGWRIYYDPRMYVFHRPHSFRAQLVQIFRFGKAAKRLERAGIRYPERDKAYYWFVPVYVLFAVAYLVGNLKETVFGRKPAEHDSSEPPAAP